MTSYEILIREHDEIEKLTGRLVAALDDPAEPATAYSHLVALSTALTSHLSREDAQVYPRLIAARDHTTAEIAVNFGKDFQSLAADWTAYLAAWTAERIALDWDSFAVHTRRIITRLSKRIAAENTLLYPAALRAMAISLR